MYTKKNEFINIVMGADDNYAMPLAVTIYSILENVDQDSNLRFYILDGGMSIISKEKLIRLIKKDGQSGHQLHWIEPEKSSIEQIPYRGWQSKSTYLRFLISKTLPKSVKKVIYLDCDLILENDISELWDYTLSDIIVRAVRDFIVQTVSHPTGVINYEQYGGNVNSPYFNAGVLLINLDFWRDEKISEKAIHYLEKNKKSFKLNDQEALNAVLIGKWKELDPLWNQQGGIFWPQVFPDTIFTEKLMNRYNNLRNNPFIIHFLSENKPWNFKCMHPFTARFIFYLEKSCWFTNFEWKKWWYRYYFNRMKWLMGDLKDTLNMVKKAG